MQKRHRGFIFRQVACLVGGIFAGLLFLFYVQNGLRQQADSVNQNLMTISTCFNDISIEMQNIRELMNFGIENRLEDEKEFTDSREKLTNSSAVLAGYMNERGYNRSSIDLQCTIETYLLDCETLMDSLENGDYSQATANYRACEQTYEFGQDKMNQVYRDIQESYVISQEQFEKYERLSKAINLATVITVITVAALLLALLNKVIVRPINSLCSKTERFLPEEGRTEPTTDLVEEKSEIALLNNSIYMMQARIGEQYRQLLEKAEMEKQLAMEKLKAVENEKWMKEAQLKNLQARINPHFLFNSINLISRMAYMENAVQTSEMLESLGEFLRYNLDNFGKIVTIQKELENVRDYTTIQKIRFGDRIDFSILADDTVAEAKIPCLILQPLVENAIIHGVGMYTENAFISVDIRKTEAGQIKMTVLDNGVGMSAQTLEEVRGKATEPTWKQEDSSIGLSNVFKRLRLFFNDAVMIRIDSGQGQFTKIQIEIPFLGKEVMEDV